MKPEEQQRVIEFLKDLLPQEYYTVANDDYVEVHKIDVNDPKDREVKDTQIKFTFNESTQ